MLEVLSMADMVLIPIHPSQYDLSALKQYVSSQIQKTGQVGSCFY